MQHIHRTARAVAAVILGTLCAATRSAAQTGSVNAQCAQSFTIIVEDACQKSADLFDFMAPQLGTVIAGGNAVIGQGGAFGRLGSFSLGLRATALKGVLPSAQGVDLSATGARRSDFPVEDQYIAAPTLDLAVGLFPGVQVGPIRIGALDALASATYIPEYDNDDLAVLTPGGSLKVGYGARVGLVQETPVTPGVAVTYLRRDLPRLDIVARTSVGGGTLDDTLALRDVGIETQAWRVVAGKRFLFLGLSAGVGQDIYSSRASLGATVNQVIPGLPISRFEAPEVTVSQRLTRTNYFVDVSLNFPGVQVVGEAGRASGGTVRNSYNSFDSGRKRADDPVVYFAASLRFGL